MQRGRCGTSCGLNTGGKWSDLAQYLAQLLHMSHNDTRLPPPCAMCILVNYIFHCRPSIVSAFTKKTDFKKGVLMVDPSELFVFGPILWLIS